MVVVLFSLCAVALSAGCNTVAGKVATHKAKDISPVHDTKTEKAKKDIRDATDRNDKDDDLLNR